MTNAIGADHVASPKKAAPAAPLSPVSPASYNFVLPAHSPLAASIATPDEKRSPTPPRLSAAARQTLNARLHSSTLSNGPRPFPLFTRSAEPSPTKSTFSTLDQSRPPPVFVPRLSDSDVSKQDPTQSGRASPSDRLRAQASRSPVVASRHTTRLPSLAQIQAKMSKTGHRRGSSVDGIPAAIPGPSGPQAKGVYRTNSNESVEVLKTPTDEMPPSQPRIVTASPERRPQSPPSPTGSNKESRLAPFLRERTSDRLAGSGAKSRPVSMPPLSGFNLNLLAFAGKDIKGKVSRSGTTSPASALAKTGSTATVPPPSPSRHIILNTPPNRYTATVYSSPASPTDSARSRSSTASPTLSVPIITCTPAPARFVRDGVEQDSDEEGGDVVLFEGDCTDDEEVKEREERERRGKQMLERLTLRRRSD